MAKKLKHLETAIAELNAPYEIDGETMESNFDFVLEERDGILCLYDRNECYHYDYAYGTYCMMCDLADEFGTEPPTEMTDSVHDKLEDALRKDWGKGAYLDWYDNVIMMVCD